MSCNHCGTKFNFFHKEVGCSNCKLSFCHKCLKQKMKVPNKGEQELPVCRTCFSNLSSNINVTANIPPPDAYLKRLEDLENPAQPPITIYKTDKKMESLRSGLSPADQQLLDRLEKLKNKDKPPPSEDEIRKRLNSLKGQNDYVEGPSNKQVFMADARTDQEKVDSILEMFIKERDIELAHNPEQGIEARLATLRGQGVRPNEGAYISNLHDSGSDDDEVDKIAKKIMDEVALDKKCSSRLPKESTSDSEFMDDKFNSSPELGWCALCNEDAKYRCLDCEDLYCDSCNIQVHKTWGDTDHKIIEYKQQ